ncbi:MAG: NAD(P)-binding protein [Symploca sp. SIO2B6]|nr:NAD(P)-binding protein [Symploca sp. SIO2B6]
MPGAFPSLSAFGGALGLANRERVVPANQDKPLSELKQDPARMVDTFIYDYPKLVRDNEQPFANVTEGSNTKVAIIGSGFAGATAAYELHRAGINPANIKIYEARRDGDGPLIGGRAYSQKFTDHNNKTYTNEMGPMRVPSNSKLFWHYLSEIVKAQVGGDPLQKVFPNPGVVATELIFQGLRYHWKGEEEPTLVHGQGDENGVDWNKLRTDMTEFIGSLEYDGDTVVDIVGLLKKEELNLVESCRILNYWKHFLLKYNDVPFIKALEDFFQDRWGEEQYSMFATLGLGTGGFGPLFPVCFQEIIRLFLWEYKNEYIPSMSMADIVNGLIGESKIPKKDILPETVSYIGLKEDDSKAVVFSINNNSSIKTAEYDYVIVATTLRSMQIRMNLDAKVPPKEYSQLVPGIKAVFSEDSDDKDTKIRESIRIPHIMNSSKLFGLVSPKPWSTSGGIENWPKYNEEPIKCVLTDTLARQMYFLDPHPNEDNASSNVLISYNWGDDSVKIMGIRNYMPWQVLKDNNKVPSPDFILKNAYQFGLEGSVKHNESATNNPIAEALESIEDNTPDQNDKLTSVVWQEEPMIFGAFKLDYPNQYYSTSQLVYQYQQAVTDVSTAGKRVYLAGNNCSFQGGWIEGAMQSGVNASAAVLKHMDLEGLLEPDTFRMNDLFEPNPFQKVLDELAESNGCAPPVEMF